MQQKVEGKTSTDHSGHLIAAQQNGPAIKENLFAQDGHLNQGPYRSMENAELGLVRNGATVYTEKTAYIPHATETGARPSAFIANDTITYADGHTQHVNLSFANLTVVQQEEYAQMAAESQIDMECENPGDTLRENMSTQEYASLMEETDYSLLNIRDEYSVATEIEYSSPANDMESGSQDSFENDGMEENDMSDAGDYGYE